MKSIKSLLVPLLMLGLLPLAGTAASKAPNCPSVAPEPLKFHKPTYIDKQRAGGEPVSITAQDGSIIVSAHAGTTHLYKDPEALPGAGDFVVGYSNQTLNWRSVDGGKSWKYVGVAGQEAGPHSPHVVRILGPRPHDGRRRPHLQRRDQPRQRRGLLEPRRRPVVADANPVAASGDRPWVTGKLEDEVFLYVNLPKQLWRSHGRGAHLLARCRPTSRPTASCSSIR